MPSISATTGAPGSLDSLSTDILKNFNVCGNGYLRIVQGDAQAQLNWSPPKLKGAAVDEPLDGLTTPADGALVFEETLDITKHPTWLARGAPGQTPGRLTGSIQFILILVDFWHLDKLDAVCLLGYDLEDEEYVSSVLDGSRQPRGRDVRDRITHLFHIRRNLWALFRDPDVENDWLREEHSMLNGQSPLSLILDGSMENLLLAREYVESAAGVR